MSSLAVLPFFFSCGNHSQQTEQKDDSLSVNNVFQREALQEAEVDNMSYLINEVSSCLDSIQIQENLIFVKREGTTDQQKVLMQLHNLKDLLARKQATIDELTKKNEAMSASSKQTIQNLKKMVDFISAQLTEKAKQVESLEEAVQNKDVKIDELRYGINELSKESEYLKEQNYQQDKELNSVYYVIGSKKELGDLGLLKSNVFNKKVQHQNIDKNNFKSADKRYLKTIPIDDKNPKLLTNNPEDSYTITENEDGTSTLEIKDAERFWSISPYLIIQK